MDTIKTPDNIEPPPSYNENNYKITDEDLNKQLGIISFHENQLFRT